MTTAKVRTGRNVPARSLDKNTSRVSAARRWSRWQRAIAHGTVVPLLAAACVGCHATTFVADVSYENGGDKGNMRYEGGQIVGGAPGDTLLFFPGSAGGAIDRKAASENVALLEYGREVDVKEIEARAAGEQAKPTGYRLFFAKGFAGKEWYEYGRVRRCARELGDNLVFRLVVANHGPDAFVGPLVIADLLGPEFEFVRLKSVTHHEFMDKLLYWRATPLESAVDLCKRADGSTMVVIRMAEVNLPCSGSGVAIDIEVVPPAFPKRAAEAR